MKITDRIFCRLFCLAALLLGLCPGGAPVLSADAETSADRTFSGFMKPFLADYCVGCHGGDRPKADLNLESFEDRHEMFRKREVWESVRHMLEEREMPPENKKQPEEEARIRVVQFINEELAKFDCDEIRRPGRTTLRRLNRVEYANTVRDLMGVEVEVADDFPLDEVGYGFDNIGDVLSLSPILMEKYLAAAEQIVDQALLDEIPAWPPVARYEAETFRSDSPDEVYPGPGTMEFHREGSASKLIEVAAGGSFRLKIRAWEQRGGPGSAELSVRFDREEARVVEVTALKTRPQIYTLPVSLTAGSHRIELGYFNDYNQQDNPVSELNGDRDLFVDYVSLEGPSEAEPPALPASHLRVFTETPEPGEESAVARRLMEAFAAKAWRRPVPARQLDRLQALMDYALEQGVNFEQAVQLAVQGVLASPRFLYRWELDPETEAGESAGERDLDAWEFASRLSYFLWSSMPDETLFVLAESGELLEPAVIEEQVERMLLDPRAEALAVNFAGQWLQFRNLETTEPDPQRFPAFDEDLRAAMRRESVLFFSTLMREDRSLFELLDADFTFVNDRLAAHYGLEGEFGPEFRRVSLTAESGRGGILTQASTLVLTSNPTRTSPVLRGKWILEQILGTPPPPPPPDVGELEEDAAAVAAATLRERLEHHRAKPECAACHARMDPIGFAFENFDAVGVWRDLDGNFPIDASGELPDGRRFDGPRELIDLLKTEETFLRTVAEKMLTFALGRGLEYYDKCAIDEILAALALADNRFSALISAVVTSDPFRKVNLQASEL